MTPLTRAALDRELCSGVTGVVSALYLLHQDELEGTPSHEIKTVMMELLAKVIGESLPELADQSGVDLQKLLRRVTEELVAGVNLAVEDK